MRYYESAYPVFASTDGVAYEIYLSGCHGYCEGCHSPHTHDFSTGLDLNDRLTMSNLMGDIKFRYDKGEVDNIVIIGGEPLDQPENELLDFLDVRFVLIADPIISDHLAVPYPPYANLVYEVFKDFLFRLR